MWMTDELGITVLINKPGHEVVVEVQFGGPVLGPVYRP